MLAAFEASLRQNAKDDAAWRKLDSQLRAPPQHVRDQQRRDAQAGRQPSSRGRTSVMDAEALIARMAAQDAMYGAG